MLIKPTLGRVVWFTPYEGDSFARGADGKCAAIVTYVHGDRCVNLAVFDANGNVVPKTSITLLQEGDARPQGGYCEWMPYQIGKARQAEELEAARVAFEAAALAAAGIRHAVAQVNAAP